MVIKLASYHHLFRPLHEMITLLYGSYCNESFIGFFPMFLRSLLTFSSLPSARMLKVSFGWLQLAQTISCIFCYVPKNSKLAIPNFTGS